MHSISLVYLYCDAFTCMFRPVIRNTYHTTLYKLMHGIWNAVKWQIRRGAVSRFLHPLPLSISRDQTELTSYEAMRIKHYDFVCILVSVIRHANRIYFIRSIILSSVAVRGYHIFRRYLIKARLSAKKSY
jgi:hypothetical protein